MFGARGAGNEVFPLAAKRKTEQIIDRVEIVNLTTKARGLDIAFRLRGDKVKCRTTVRAVNR